MKTLYKIFLLLMLSVSFKGFASETEDRKYLCGDFTWVQYSILRVNNWPMCFYVIYPKDPQLSLDNKSINTFVKSAISDGYLISECIVYEGIYEKMFNCWNEKVWSLAYANWQLMITYNQSDSYTYMQSFSLDSGELVAIGCYNVSGCFILDDDPCRTSDSLDFEYFLGQNLNLSFYSPIALFDFAKPNSFTYSISSLKE